jgi:hypothetical protein
MLKKNWLKIVLFLVVFTALVLTATFTDLWVSKTLVDLDQGEYYSNNGFGVFVEVIGSFPIYYMIGLSVIILGFNARRFKNEKLGVALLVVALVVSFIAMYIGSDDCMDDFADHSKKYAEFKEIFKLF